MDKGRSVLVVDDNDIFLSAIEELFLTSGYSCKTASNAEDAMGLIRTNSFDIMLTDISLPGMSGFDLTRQAKQLRPDMMIIVMTGFIEDFSYDGAIEAGATDFIKKPFTLKELKARIAYVEIQERQRLMAITDELTGLYNRRGFMTLIDKLLKLAKRRRRGMFMLYADVDKLKLINDTLGHQEGDLALIDTADLLRATYRESDIIARIGGDEFIVIPIGTAGDDVDGVAARLQESIALHNAKAHRKFTLSVSTGIAFYDPETPSSIDQLLMQADKMMYEEKKQKSGS